jgi:hypothetical protein
MVKAPLDLVVFGAGERARDAYGTCVEQRPDEARFVAVAEPNVPMDEYRSKALQSLYAH